MWNGECESAAERGGERRRQRDRQREVSREGYVVIQALCLILPESATLRWQLDICNTLAQPKFCSDSAETSANKRTS